MRRGRRVVESELWRVGRDVVRVRTFRDGSWSVEMLDEEGRWVVAVDDAASDASFDALMEVLTCGR